MSDRPSTNTPLPIHLRPRNRATERAHRREMLWQVWLPFGLLMLLMLASFVAITVGAFAGVGGNAAASVWADALFIWMIIPVIFAVLVVFVLVAALVYGLFRLYDVLPPYFKVAQDFVARVNVQTRRYADQIAAQVLNAEARVRQADETIKGARAMPQAVLRPTNAIPQEKDGDA